MYNLISGQNFRIFFNYNPHRNDVEINQLDVLPRSGGPTLYSEDESIIEIVDHSLING